MHKNDVASRARADIIHVKRSGIVGNRLTNNDVGLGQLAAGFVFVKRSSIRRDRLKTGLQLAVETSRGKARASRSPDNCQEKYFHYLHLTSF